MEYTLMDVSDVIAARRQSTFKNLRCYIVNYTATNEFPHKFWYNGCSVARANGTYCSRASCEHAKGLSRPMYRFQLQLTDRSPSPPVTVTIFDQAQILMGLSAEQLRTGSAEAQKELVRERTSRKESVECTIGVKEDSYSGEFVGVVQLLLLVDNIQDEVVMEVMGTLSPSPGLARSSRNFYTPRTNFQSRGTADESTGCTSGGESSSARRGRVCRGTSSQLSNVKTKLQDLIDVIDLTSLED